MSVFLGFVVASSFGQLERESFPFGLRTLRVDELCFEERGDAAGEGVKMYMRMRVWTSVDDRFGFGAGARVCK